MERLQIHIEELGQAEYKKDRAMAVIRAREAFQDLVDLLFREDVNRDIRFLSAITRLLSSIGTSSLFVQYKYHISDHKEFQIAVDELKEIFPQYEDLQI